MWALDSELPVICYVTIGKSFNIFASALYTYQKRKKKEGYNTFPTSQGCSEEQTHQSTLRNKKL